MAVPDQRDPEETGRQLRDWLAGRLATASDVAVHAVESPGTTGFSNESLPFDAEWTDEGHRHRGSYVARVAPTRYQVFPEPRFAADYRLMRLLDQHTDIPVPPVHWYERNDAVLGAPFFVMTRIDGRVPADFPPYHADGWVTEVSPQERADMWWGALRIVARLNALSATELDVGFLDQPRYGATGIDQRLGYYAHYLDWAYDGPQPTNRAALTWLRERQPAEDGPVQLLWGDARIGNVIFRDGEPRAVLDWETAVLGQPEEDLAWFCYLDRHHSEGIDAPRLPGFPTAAETVAAYEKWYGRPMRHLDYYEALSAFKFSVIMTRIGKALVDFGWVPPDSDFPHNNTATHLLAKTLGLSPPAAEPTRI